MIRIILLYYDRMRRINLLKCTLRVSSRSEGLLGIRHKHWCHMKPSNIRKCHSNLIRSDRALLGNIFNQFLVIEGGVIKFHTQPSFSNIRHIKGTFHIMFQDVTLCLFSKIKLLFFLLRQQMSPFYSIVGGGYKSERKGV